MEKCTFCVQRINAVEIQAKAETRDLRDGDVTPACAQACPATALVFGDLDHPDSRVSQLARSRRATRLLDDLGTQPKAIYLQQESWHD